MFKKIKIRFINYLREKLFPKNKNFINVEILQSSNVSIDCIIGEYTYIGNNCTITKSIIGRYCSIANNVSIGIGEHDISKISTSSLFYEKPYETLTKLAPCLIGNDVWIGTNCVIRRGVKIGDGAVIGANSFVNKDVPDFAVVAGIPAKVIKYRFSFSKIELIKDSDWWYKNINEAHELIVILNESQYETI